MRKNILFLLIFFASVSSGFNQDQSDAPRLSVKRAVYFDISPPLRDMIQNPPVKADLSWKDGVVRNYVNPKYGSPEEKPAGFTTDMALQDRYDILPGDTTIQNFEGLWNVSGYVPPDTYGEVGPNNYFQVVNCSYAIFNKSGAKIFGPFQSSSIWNGMPNNDNSGDAVVHYDENANRWLFSQFSLPYSNGPWYQMIAVSVTPDPMGSWYRWEYEFDAMPDYPKFGVWPDAYYMSANYFYPGSGWIGNSACAYDRTAMLAGDPSAVRISFTLNPGSAGFITLYPSDCDGTFPVAGTPNYFAYIKTGGTQVLGLYEFHADFATPANSTFGNLLSLPVTPFANLQDGIPQLGSDKKLETLADRLMYRLQYRKFNGYESMVVNHTVNAGSGIAGVRWYELRKTTGPWSIYQQSTYAPADNNSRWMGSIAIDTAGSIALGYSVSGTTIYPSIRYTGRLKGDPLNQMTIAEQTIVQGGGSQTGSWSGRSRWGDYSGMSVDPANPTTFWYTTEYYTTTSNSSWTTRIASFTFDDVFSSGASATPAQICIGDSSQLEALPYGGSSNYTYSWSSVPAGFTSTLKNPVVSPSDTTLYVVATSDGTTTRYDTTEVKVALHPTAFAGNDTTICEWADSVVLNGMAANYRNVAWGSLGDGSFSNRYVLQTTYYPGPEDRAAGGVDIRLLAFAKSPCSGKFMSNKHLTIDPCTGIQPATDKEFSLKIFPNPASDEVILTIAGMKRQQGTITITGPDGRTAFSMILVAGKEESVQKIDLSGYSRGIYIITVRTDKGAVHERLVVQ